jgi:hypothetical protein
MGVTGDTCAEGLKASGEGGAKGDVLQCVLRQSAHMPAGNKLTASRVRWLTVMTSLLVCVVPAPESLVAVVAARVVVRPMLISKYRLDAPNA